MYWAAKTGMTQAILTLQMLAVFGFMPLCHYFFRLLYCNGGMPVIFLNHAVK